MIGRSTGALVYQLQRVAADCDASVPDSALLLRFEQARDPAAFELIVWRHGAMVQAVCRRVLGRCAEVDDAFQATFLVLLQKSRSIRNRDSLGGWLHGVAFRVAHRCRRSLLSRQRHERGAARAEVQYPRDPDRSELGPILHAEIDRLPERLRQPFVLCEIEGRSNSEAAELLAVPDGTIRSRLSRARERLRRRLTQRGVVLGAAGFASALVVEPVSAALVASAVRAVFHSTADGAVADSVSVLAKGVIQAMFFHKLKLTATGLAAAGILCVAGVTYLPRQAPSAKADEIAAPRQNQKLQARAEPPAGPASPKDEGRPKSEKPPQPTPLDLLMPTKPLYTVHPDELNLIGGWKITDSIVGGEARDPEDKVMIIGPFGTMRIKQHFPNKDAVPMTYRINPRVGPATIDLIAGGKTQQGIYSLHGDQLQICLSINWAVRPGVIASEKGSDTLLLRLRKTGQDTDTGWADAMFVKGRSFDFGVIKRNGEFRFHEFIFKNVYDRPVRLLAISDFRKGSPTDLTMWWSDNGIMIGPGEEGWIEPGEESAITFVIAEEYRFPDKKHVAADVKLKFAVKGFGKPASGGSGPGTQLTTTALGESWATVTCKFAFDSAEAK